MNSEISTLKVIVKNKKTRKLISGAKIYWIEIPYHVKNKIASQRNIELAFFCVKINTMVGNGKVLTF